MLRGKWAHWFRITGSKKISKAVACIIVLKVFPQHYYQQNIHLLPCCSYSSMKLAKRVCGCLLVLLSQLVICNVFGHCFREHCGSLTVLFATPNRL